MWTSRFAYALTLLCGGAFYLFYPGRLSFFTLVLLLVLPFLSLGLTLLSLRRLSLEVGCDQPPLRQGAAASLRLVLRGPGLLSGVPVRLRCRLENRLYPQLSQSRRLSLACNVPQQLELPTGHCGWLAFTVETCRLADWLGLFSLPVKAPAPALALVWPRPDRQGTPVDLTPAHGLPLRPKPGGGPGEDYELRPYRPGDSVQSIHWKLTAKQPAEADPVLRETVEPLQEAIVVTYDHFGDPDQVDALLGQLEALTQALLAQERPFTLCWTDPEQGGAAYYLVDCPNAWDHTYRALAGRPAPLSGQGGSEHSALTPPGHSGPVRRIHLTLTGKGAGQ